MTITTERCNEIYENPEQCSYSEIQEIAAMLGDRLSAREAVPVEFIPKNLDKALAVVGVAIPESREEFNFQTERYIQRLIDRVIRYSDEFTAPPAPAVPGNSREIPEGWKLVPVDMTDAIGEAIAMEANCCGGIALDIYEAMLAAAPEVGE